GKGGNGARPHRPVAPQELADTSVDQTEARADRKTSASQVRCSAVARPGNSSNVDLSLDQPTVHHVLSGCAPPACPIEFMGRSGNTPQRGSNQMSSHPRTPVRMENAMVPLPGVKWSGSPCVEPIPYRGLEIPSETVLSDVPWPTSTSAAEMSQSSVAS